MAVALAACSDPPPPQPPPQPPPADTTPPPPPPPQYVLEVGVNYASQQIEKHPETDPQACANSCNLNVNCWVASFHDATVANEANRNTCVLRAYKDKRIDAPGVSSWVKPGAPPPPAPVVVERVVVNENRIKLNEEIIFKEGSAELDPKSVEYVNYIARVIREHEGLDFIEIGGHANTDGPDSINTPLSQKRAETVVKALVDAGVSPRRLRAVGYGSFCPLDPSKTPEALKVNKRVEFAILRRNGKNLKDKWDGCDGALGHKDAKGKNYSPQPIPATAPRTKEWVVKSAKIKLNGFQLVFSDQVRFQPQTATIVPATEPALAALQAFLASDKSITKVRIEGHTDPPDSPDMVALSKARSIKVAEWLANHGIDRGRLLPVGCGGSRPIQKGGVIDYDKSRRTEAHIIGKNGAPVNGPEIPPGCSAD